MTDEPDGSFNPFQPPASLAADVDTLADDAEFLFSSNEILCRDSVELPQVCIRLADTDNLVKRQQNLRVVAGPFVAAIILLAIPVIALSVNFGARGLIAAVVVGGILQLIVRFVAKTSLPFTYSVDATWYVGERYLRRVKWYNRISRVVVMGVAIVISVLVAVEARSLQDAAIQIIVALGLGIAVSFGLSTERKLMLSGRRFFGRHRGLMVLSGHSKKFAAAAQRIQAGF